MIARDIRDGQIAMDVIKSISDLATTITVERVDISRELYDPLHRWLRNHGMAMYIHVEGIGKALRISVEGGLTVNVARNAGLRPRNTPRAMDEDGATWSGAPVSLR